MFFTSITYFLKKIPNAHNYADTLNHTFVSWATVSIKPDTASLFLSFSFFDCTRLFIEALLITIVNVVNDQR